MLQLVPESILAEEIYRLGILIYSIFAQFVVVFLHKRTHFAFARDTFDDCSVISFGYEPKADMQILLPNAFQSNKYP